MKTRSRLVWLLLVILLLGCAPAAHAGAPQAPDDPASVVYLPFIAREWTPTPVCLPTFSDDFSNPLSGWPIQNPGNYVTEYLAGEYRMLLKVDLDVTVVRPGILADDYIMAADMRRASITDGTWGLMFGANDSWTQLYTFEVGPNQDYYLWRFNSGAWSVLAQGVSTFINPQNDTNRLKVERNGATIKIYANGHLLRTVTNTAYTGLRYMGFVITTYDETNLDVRFDNFALYPVSCGENATGAPVQVGESGSRSLLLPDKFEKLPQR
jgi:hypothetical protein